MMLLSNSRSEYSKFIHATSTFEFEIAENINCVQNWTCPFFTKILEQDVSAVCQEGRFHLKLW